MDLATGCNKWVGSTPIGSTLNIPGIGALYWYQTVLAVAIFTLEVPLVLLVLRIGP